MNNTRIKRMLGVAAITVIVCLVVLAQSSNAGTVGAASLYNAETMSDSDVVLATGAHQQWLRSMLSDPAKAADPAFLRLPDGFVYVESGGHIVPHVVETSGCLYYLTLWAPTDTTLP
jgi:hypothetical protein